MDRVTMTKEEWEAEGKRRFGPDVLRWKFVCPACGHIACVKDWKDAGAVEQAVAFSCVGRWIAGSRKWLGGEGPGPCDYTGGGLFAINPVLVKDGSHEYRVFAFAPAERVEGE